MEYHGHYKGCHIEKYLLKMPSNQIWVDSINKITASLQLENSAKSELSAAVIRGSALVSGSYLTNFKKV